MFFIIGYKTCFLMFFILTSMFFTTMAMTWRVSVTCRATCRIECVHFLPTRWKKQRHVSACNVDGLSRISELCRTFARQVRRPFNSLYPCGLWTKQLVIVDIWQKLWHAFRSLLLTSLNSVAQRQPPKNVGDSSMNAFSKTGQKRNILGPVGGRLWENRSEAYIFVKPLRVQLKPY